MLAKEAVPVRQRAVAWASSVVVGVAMLFVFEAVLRVAPAREFRKILGEMAAIPSQTSAAPVKASSEEAKAAMAEHRATVSALHALYQGKAKLEQECRTKRFLAALIGLVASVGCFALCSVYWARRGAKEAALSGSSAGAGGP